MRWSTRTITTLIAASLGLVAAAPAWAVATITINSGNVPTTAAGFSTHECDANLGGGPFPGQDVWVFVLPQPNTQGDFTSLHLNFSTPGGTVTRDIPTDPDSAIVNDMGTSKAWIKTPAGWTLTDGTTTAVITGDAGNNPHFNLTHTCPASGSPSPSVSPTVTPTATPTVRPTVTPTVTPTKTSLPITGTTIEGQSLSVVAGVGAITIIIGIGLTVARRRRNNGQGA